MKYLTVGQLRKLIENVSDDAIVSTYCENACGFSHPVYDDGYEVGHGPLVSRYGEKGIPVDYIELAPDEGASVNESRLDE